MANVTFWGFHASPITVETLVFERNELAIGWPALGDLSRVATDRDSLKSALVAAYPNQKPGAVPGAAGQLYRFVNEMQPADVVVFRAKTDGLVHLGRLEGTYFFDTTGSADYPNRRRVAWQKAVPITAVSQGALYELGAFLTLFQVKNYADEWDQLLSGAAPPEVEEPATTVAGVYGATEQNTRDFVIKQLAKELKGHPFALFVAQLLETMGYRTQVGPEGADGGVDITAHRGEIGFEPPIVRVQVKSTEGSIGGPTVSELIGNLAPGEYGLLVTLGGFSPQARQKAAARSNVVLMDGNDLVSRLLDHYEDLDPRYKRVIPLKRMYVPYPLAEE